MVADVLYPITVPKWGIEMQEGTITGWQVAVGAAVNKGDELVDIETDKIVNTMEAPVGGVVCRQLVEAGATLRVGELLGVIATGDADDSDIDAFVRDFVPADASFGIDAGAEDETATLETVALSEPAGEIRVSPVARRRAKELGVDLSTVTGTGRNGRISKEDVEAAAKGEATATFTPFSSRRASIARRVTAAKQQVPHYYLTRSVDVSNAIACKSESVSFNAVLLKAAALALADHPKMNCHVFDEGTKPRPSIDINMAVDTERGMASPLLCDVDRTSLSDLTTAAKVLGAKARDNKLTADDLELGGITVSNLGPFGIDSFTAIINPPQAAVLAIGAANGNKMTVTMSADHRLIDGADAARFLQSFATHLETIKP